MRVVLRDTIRFDPDQPEQLVVGSFRSLRLSGTALYGDDVVIARHESGLGWAVADRPMRDDESPDPRSFVYSDLTIE